MYIEDIGRPSQPITWILQEINRKVRINYYDEMVSPDLKELDYENELSEMALEYVDQIVLKHDSNNSAPKNKRVSSQSFNDKTTQVNPINKKNANSDEK